MKTIVFKIPEYAQNSYVVLLGNGNRIQFKSKRELGYFMAKMNRQATEWMICANELFIECLTQFRRAWILFTDNSGQRSKHEFNTRQNLQLADDRLEHLSWRYRNDLYMFFVELKKIVLFLEHATDEMISFYTKKQNTIQIIILNGIKNRISGLRSEIVNYAGF